MRLQIWVEIIRTLGKSCVLYSLSAILALGWMTASAQAEMPAAEGAATITKQDVQLALDHMAGLQEEAFPVFSTLVRTYKIVPSTPDIWPQATGEIWYWGGGIVNMLAFQNIVMLVHNGDTDFKTLAASSGATAGYVKRFNKLYAVNAKNDDVCYFERFTSRWRWISKGVIIADLTKSGGDPHKLLIECAAAGADFVNGLPFSSHRASLSDMPPASVRAVLNHALYQCSLSGVTEVQDPEASRDGLTERPSRSCLIDHLNKKLLELSE